MSNHPCNPEHQKKHEIVRQKLMELFAMDDTLLLDLLIKLQRTAQLCDIVDTTVADGIELSGPRWRLMSRLYIEEKLGNREGITPTVLSLSQRVSKNTISSLLRGLEEQDLIHRNLDPVDRRAFRIQLTETGRSLILKSAPGRIANLNTIFSGLSKEEKEQLLALLEKLHASLLNQIHSRQFPGQCPEAPASRS